MTIIGETTDDAVGEAFDKSAKILGLPYQSLVDQHAQLGNQAFVFTNLSSGLNFSFSGLKQPYCILYKEKLENPDFIMENINDICASIQYTIVEILMDKLKLAVKKPELTNRYRWWCIC
jgi:N6-L-threonylcarbamoyladenine synthase